MQAKQRYCKSCFGLCASLIFKRTVTCQVASDPLGDHDSECYCTGFHLQILAAACSDVFFSILNIRTNLMELPFNWKLPIPLWHIWLGADLSSRELSDGSLSCSGAMIWSHRQRNCKWSLIQRAVISGLACQLLNSVPLPFLFMYVLFSYCTYFYVCGVLNSLRVLFQKWKVVKVGS